MPFSACLGTLLRRLRTLQGLTQAELGRRTGYDGSYIGASERAAVHPSRVLIQRCDDILQAGGALPALWALADREWGARTAPVPPVPGTGPGVRRGGDAMPRRPIDAAADELSGPAAAASPGPGDAPVLEAMELARRAEASRLGDEAMAGLERAVARLQRAALATPPEELIPAVRAQRGYAGRLLGGPLTLGRHRRLLVAAGQLSLLLARLHFDAGDREAAEADRDTALCLACQADHGELAALAVELPASWALADGRFDDALTLARNGQELAPPASMAAVQLALDEAHALALLGRPEEAAGADHLAALTSAMLPGRQA
jgi:hypothetical protein